MTTVFSRIIAGELPSVRVYEDPDTLAFMDINPASRGHTLVIPRQAFVDLFDLPPELAAAVARTTQLVAKAVMQALQPDGINIVQNNGSAAGQVVMHYHVHIIPRWQNDRVLHSWQPHTADPAELQRIGEQIRAAIIE